MKQENSLFHGLTLPPHGSNNGYFRQGEGLKREVEKVAEAISKESE